MAFVEGAPGGFLVSKRGWPIHWMVTVLVELSGTHHAIFLMILLLLFPHQNWLALSMPDCILHGGKQPLLAALPEEP